MTSTTENVSKFRFVSTNVIPKILISAIALIIIILNASPLYSATCTPASAQLCAAVDDTADIYLNGVFLDTFPYCDVSGACTPKCISLSGAQLALLTATGNVISVRTLNTGYNEIWASWSLDVTCASGGHSYVSSGTGAGVSMYHDASACPADQAPNDGSGRTWYDPLYNQGTSGVSWVAPIIENGQKYGKRRFDPQTGSLLPALSYSADSDTQNGDCMQVFFRQGFDLPEEPTPVPPNFTIVKSANPTTNIGLAPPYEVTFTIRVCNTGGGTFGQPVTINDQWSDSANSWEYFWPGNYTDSILGAINKTGSGKTAAITFADGFPANTCYNYIYAVKLYSGVPTFCDVWHNVAGLQYLTTPTPVSTVTLNNYCPPPPNFTMVKSASKTSFTGRDEQATFTMRLCNTGGAAWNGSMYILDDYTSAPGDWQYEGPYNWDNPAPGIDYIDTTEPMAKQRRFRIVFQQPGFTGCVDIPMYLKTAYNYQCGPWNNLARVESYMTSPTIESTVNMVNLCSPTFTPTYTRTITPSRTMTLTYTFTYTRTPTPSRTVTNTFSIPTNTFTRTFTPTFTRTNTPTFTRTPQPTMDITKTANVGVATFGDTITYTLNYHNTGTIAANPVCIYDTVPAQITYINSSLAPTTGAPFLSWCIGSVAPGGSGTITWWGRITAYPLNPLFEMKMYLGEIMIYKKEVIATYREYENQSLAFLSYVIRE